MNKKKLSLIVAITFAVLYPLTYFIPIGKFILIPALYVFTLYLRPLKFKYFLPDLALIPLILGTLIAVATSNSVALYFGIAICLLFVLIWSIYITYQRSRGIDPFL